MDPKPLKILGIDPGTARLGYALIDFQQTTQAVQLKACGVISTHKDYSDALRLKEIREDLEKIINEYKPDILSVEKIFFFKNLKTVISVAQARGVILEIGASSGMQIYEYTPLEMKKIITGSGTASKDEVAEYVHRYLKLEKKITPDDAVDAVGMAICFVRNDAMRLKRSAVLN